LTISPGWFGYDLLVNKQIVDAKTTAVLRYDGKAWVEAAHVPYAVKANRLELAVPRALLGLDNRDAFTFDFHWADNPAALDTPISLCTRGDSAPNRRFNYRCIWKK
jgi:hypothetical protein